MSKDVWQVLDELDAKPAGEERVNAARDALAATVMGLLPDPENRVKAKCLEIIREDYLRAVRVDERGGN